MRDVISHITSLWQQIYLPTKLFILFIFSNVYTRRLLNVALNVDIR